MQRALHLVQDVYKILRDALKEMMTPELASKTLQLYTGLIEDFFGLEARAPEEVWQDIQSCLS